MSQLDQAKSEYFRTKVLTASPQELQLMLYDGAIRFAEDARQAIEENRIEDSHNALVRSQNIVLEMSSSLDHEADPDLCGKLASLYNFIYRRLVDANMKHDVEAIDDALRILKYQRETWILLMEKLTEESRPEGSTPEQHSDDTPPDQRPSLSLSV